MWWRVSRPPRAYIAFDSPSASRMLSSISLPGFARYAGRTLRGYLVHSHVPDTLNTRFSRSGTCGRVYLSSASTIPSPYTSLSTTHIVQRDFTHAAHSANETELRHARLRDFQLPITRLNIVPCVVPVYRPSTPSLIHSFFLV